MIFAFTTFGDMNVGEVREECRTNKFAPLLIYEFEGKVTLPYFTSVRVCKEFCRRNLPKKWLSGAIYCTDDDLKTLADHDMQLKEFSWPKKIKNLVSWDVHIHEFDDTPEFTTG